MIKLIFKNYVPKFFLTLLQQFGLRRHTLTYNLIIFFNVPLWVLVTFFYIHFFCFIKPIHCTLHLFELMRTRQQLGRLIG